MARLELNRSLRPASCCSVEVMNGAEGDRRNGLWVIELTTNGTSASPAARALASSSPSTTTEPGEVRTPVSSKSRPEARAVPSTAVSAAVNERGTPSVEVPPETDSPSGVNVASIPHHPAERNAIRARSRSTTMRVATLWTRPAESRGMIFFHRTGDTS